MGGICIKNVVEHLGHFNGIIPSLGCILIKQHGVRGEKFLQLKTSGNAISESINFRMSLDTSALKNLCLWCEFQSRLLFIISLLLKNFLTPLYTSQLHVESEIYAHLSNNYDSKRTLIGREDCWHESMQTWL